MWLWRSTSSGQTSVMECSKTLSRQLESTDKTEQLQAVSCLMSVACVTVGRVLALHSTEQTLRVTAKWIILIGGNYLKVF